MYISVVYKLNHFGRIHGLVVLRLRQQAAAQNDLPQGQALLVGGLGAGSGRLVADVWGQAGHQHQGLLQQVLHAAAVGLKARHAVVVKGAHHISQQVDGLEEVVGADGHEHIQLKVALAGGHAHGHVVAHDLHGHHGHRFALGWVDLAGHDGAAGLVLGNGDLPQAAAGTAGQPADVVGDLHQVGGQSLQSSVGEDEAVLAGEGVELVGGGAEGLSGVLGDEAGGLLAEGGGGVEPGSHGGAAQG